MNMAEVIQAMKTCEQMKGLTVWQHGEKVLERYQDLFLSWQNKTPHRLSWQLPTWYDKYKNFLFNDCPNFDIMSEYLLYHDCGKPFCKTIDSEGKVHFPDHANVSKDIWIKYCQAESNTKSPLVAELIGQDMDIHLLKADGLEEFAKRKNAPALLLAGLSEIHANAELFGGTESVGFKIKLKHIESRGKQICKLRYGEQK